MTASSRARRRVPWLLLLLVVAAAAAAVRVLAARNDLWLDELVSVERVNMFHSPIEIFTEFRIDNNNPLNSIYLYMLGKYGYLPLLARLMSIVFGVASVPLAYWAGSRRRRRTRLVFALLVALNYPLIHFSSEARGYSGAAFAGLLAYGAVDRFLTRPRAGWVLLFTLACLVGALSHLTFCIIWLALFIWSFVLLLKSQRPATALRRMAALYGPSAVMWVVLYFGFVRGLIVPGSYPNLPTQQLCRILALALGSPFESGWPFWLVIGTLLALSVWHFFPRRGGRMEWLLLVLVFVPPMCVVLSLPKTYFFARHLLVIVPFICMLVALVMTGGRRGGTRRTPLPTATVAGLLIALSLAGQATLYGHFLKVGRGNISEAATFLAAHSSGPVIVIGSDQYARQIMEFPYLEAFLPRDKSLATKPVPGGPRVPEWYVVHHEGGEPPGPAAFVTPAGDRFVRAAFWPSALLSGQAWTLYHLEAVGTSAPATRR